MDYNAMASVIYKQNKQVGWWDDPNRCIITTLQLVNTEIAEATEGYRKGIMDDHLPHRKMEEVELADAMIRVLDLAGKFDWNYNEFKYEINIPNCILNSKNSGEYHFWLTNINCHLGKSYYHGDRDKTEDVYCELVSSIRYVAESLGFDLEGAMLEKLEYNRHRSDHKRENRAKEGGKKV